MRKSVSSRSAAIFVASKNSATCSKAVEVRGNRNKSVPKLTLITRIYSVSYQQVMSATLSEYSVVGITGRRRQNFCDQTTERLGIMKPEPLNPSTPNFDNKFRLVDMPEVKKQSP